MFTASGKTAAPEQVSLKVGMPPTALELATSAPISDALQTMETIIVAVSTSSTGDQQTATATKYYITTGERAGDKGSDPGRDESGFQPGLESDDDDPWFGPCDDETLKRLSRPLGASPERKPCKPSRAPASQTPEEKRAMAAEVLLTLLHREGGNNSTKYGALLMKISDPAPPPLCFICSARRLDSSRSSPARLVCIPCHAGDVLSQERMAKQIKMF